MNPDIVRVTYLVNGIFSAACNKAIDFGTAAQLRDDWDKVFEADEIASKIQRIN